MIKPARIAFSFLFLVSISSCFHPTIRDVRQDASPTRTGPLFNTPRECAIEIDPVLDQRPVYEVDDTNQTKMQSFVPLIIWFQWAKAGPVFSDPKYYGRDLPTAIHDLLRDVIKKSGVCSGAGPRFKIHVELLHFYGVSYTKYSGLFSPMGVAARTEYTFYPTGFVSLKISLFDANTARFIGDGVLSESFLFNPSHPLLSTQHTAYGPGQNIDDNRSQVAMLALQRLMSRLPYFVDQLLSRSASERPGHFVSPNTFTLLRLTDEYDYQEELEVEIGTGRILRNDIVERTFPPYSRPDEWVVARTSSQGHWLDHQGYQELLNRLDEKYLVEWGSNASAALFKGARSHSVPSTPYFPTDPIKKEEILPAANERIILAQACEMKDGRACVILGTLWANGEGGPSDENHARDLFAKACALDNGRGCSELGVRLYAGEEKDLPAARLFFSKACDLYYGEGCAHLGSLHYNGEGGPPDHEKTREFYAKACALKSGKACLWLGNLWMNGEGGPQDRSKAKELFREACSLGAPEACKYYNE